MAFAPLGETLDRWSRRSGLAGQLEILERAWNAEMGGWARMARPVALDRGSLVIEVMNSAAMQEITLRRQELLRRLNRHFAAPFLQHLTVQLSHGR